MLDINLIRENPEKVKTGIKKKGYDPVIVDRVLKVDETRRQLIGEIEKWRAARNKLGPKDIEQGRKVKEMLRKLEPDLKAVEEELKNLLYEVPNLPLEMVPVGKSGKENVVVRQWPASTRSRLPALQRGKSTRGGGKPSKLSFKVLDHVELGEKLELIDFKSAAKVAGSDFYFLTNEGALLELALVQYAFGLLAKEGFSPIITTDLARSRFYIGTGYLPKGPEAQTFKIEDQDLGLIATAEVTLAGKHADEILEEKQLPLKYIGYSHCFRQESGAYGQYSRGTFRVHQFTKAEMFIYCLPEESNKWHEQILALEEKIYQALEIPYRVVEMCTGDLGAMAARKFDVEAWMPGRGDYGEVTSTSNCTDYQARNLNIRYQRANGEKGFVHMLNGTAIATSRTILAILENYQQKDGSVLVPKVLQKYCGFKKISPRK